ncbi:hypothetical protein RHOSPDRAFT_35132 [Rhodotorula sp. JG-1b]|nr:hypothetical protein RHOSPDRAFT_35132 [Rhodotorula sp. JG-1b]
MQAADSDKKPQDEPPPPLTAAQKARIKHSPVHVRLRHTTYGSLAIGVISPLTNVAALIFAAVWAKYILQQDRWFIFHYVLASFLSLLWMGYTVLLFYHVKYGGYPDQIKIDIGWIMMADAFACCFLFYIFYKMRTYGLPDMFNLACSSGCGSKLQFVKWSPLVLAITSILFGLVQLFLCYRVYKNPLVQIPLDEHGMPMLQNPEDGTPLPIGPDGKPILPAWLQPPKSSSESSPAAATAERSSSTPLVKTPSRSSKSSSAAYGHSDGGESALSESENSEVRPLQKKAPTSEKTLGRDRPRRHGSRRSRR